MNNLNDKYKNFVHRMLTQLNEVSDFNKLITLIYEKDRLFKRNIKKITITAIMKRFNKKQKNKKKKNNNLECEERTK